MPGLREAQVLRLTSRVKQWDKDIERLAESCTQIAPLYRALQALRGVATIVAATIAAEIGDLPRFSSPSKLMSYLGLAPSERSSGPKVSRGSITKAGNPHVRWKLIQAAWQYRHRPAMSRVLRMRNEEQPKRIRDIAWKAQKRLNQRYWSMTARGKRVQVTIVAIARELCGFIWAIGQEVPKPTA